MIRILFYFINKILSGVPTGLPCRHPRLPSRSTAENSRSPCETSTVALRPHRRTLTRRSICMHRHLFVCHADRHRTSELKALMTSYRTCNLPDRAVVVRQKIRSLIELFSSDRSAFSPPSPNFYEGGHSSLNPPPISKRINQSVPKFRVWWSDDGALGPDFQKILGQT